MRIIGMDSPAQQRSRAKLLHAIVGLGLAAASCGGKAASDPSDGMGTSTLPAQASGTSSSSHSSSSSGNLASQDDASVADASDGADSTMTAADALAADVAAEAWIPVPIR
jgi:hypothetical protein